MTQLKEPNPHRAGACPACGNYRYDGRHPYLHEPGCPDEDDPQIDRWLAERQSGDQGGSLLYCSSHDHPIPSDHPLARMQAMLDSLPPALGS